MSDRGILFVVSAPSGGGKRSILHRVMEDDPKLVYSVSATTRSPRPDEVDGESYRFIDTETFRQWIDEGRFVEWAEVHGQLYGTPKDGLFERLEDGRDVVLELDVQGMRLIRQVDEDAVTIFIVPPSFEVLEQRLRGRGDSEEDDIVVRLRNAKEEIAAKGEFDFVVVNDVLDRAVEQFKNIVEEQRKERGRI